MPLLCLVNNCSNSYILTKEKKIKLFQITEDLTLYKHWLSNCGRQDLSELPIDVLHNYYRICPNHFKENMFTNNEKTTLLPGAIPTEFDIEPSDFHGTSNPSTRKHRSKMNPKTVGDLSPSHFTSEEKRKKYVDMIKQKYKEKQVENANLKKQVRYLERRLIAYQGVFQF
ncbi:Zinc finger, C2CH-type [Cinara cedri]|uniref:Zinc finger, C2CH-type n=1 Tax=Cinara cedri TaxID=506608 RepID=A0A5E4MEU7_9HEMI|nr:Zinc finger, C2CH-type [Cinara cedri]